MGTLFDARKEILSKIDKPVCYDLGCGQSPEDGFRGIDYSAKGENIVNADLFSYPWPIESESVDYFRSSHFIEHVPSWDAHFNEIYRCLKIDGHYEVIAPYYRNDRWLQDPDHKQAISHQRFAYLNRQWLTKNRNEHRADLARVNFDVYNGAWFELLNEGFRDQGFSADYIAWWKAHGWNVIDDLAVILTKLPMDE